MAVTPAERRRFQRVTFNAQTLLSQGEQVWQSALIDVSLKGLLISTPEHFNGDAAQPFTAQICLNEQLVLDMQVSLSHQNAHALGFVCLHIDIDSITHLRRLIELNLGDAALLERDLQALGEPTQTAHPAPAQDV